MDKQLLALLVCPVSHAALVYNQNTQELVCRASGLAYPIRDGLPVMLETEARHLTAEEKLEKKYSGDELEYRIKIALMKKGFKKID